MNIVITGASRGIGFETAKLLAKEHNVFCLSRNTRPITDLQNTNIVPISFDLESFDTSALDTYFQSVGKVDRIINNAGLLINKPLEELTADDLQRMYQVNAIAPQLLVQYFLPKLENGHVVNISSMGGVQGTAKFSGLSGYSSSKGAVTILTECLAEELKDKNISVNALALGAVQTEMLSEAFPDYQAPLSAQEMAEYIADFTLKGQKYFNGKVLNVALTTP